MNKENNIAYIAVNQLHPHPDNPRKDLGDLTELADSIKGNGIYQNLTVIPDEDGYTVIIGHRRLAAAKLAGLAEVPCVVTEMDPKEQMQTMLLENMQRSDLNVYEQAQGFQMMLDLGSTVEEIAEKSGFSQTTVRRRVKMMELDQKKLKEVSSRQLSIGDFDTLAQIEDIKARNKVLESIGTKDFNSNVNQALVKQKEKHNLPLVKKWLKEVGAIEIKSSDAYGSKYETFGGRYSWYISKWGEEGCIPPEVGKTQIFYVLNSYGSLSLYKKREKAKPVKKSKEELAREQAVKTAWELLEAAEARACDLRKQFVEKLSLTGKNRATVLSGALIAGVHRAIQYHSSEDDIICKVLGIEGKYSSGWDEKMIDGLKNLDDKDLPTLVYALFGDDGDLSCVKYHYRGDFPEYERNVLLTLLYDWLISLGYEMGTEETQLLNGSHELFRKEEQA